jgi:uncharacterized protein YecT (DUF1311 family)
MIATVPLALALLASVQAGEDQANCDDPPNTPEMRRCASLEFQRADAELNAVWGEAIAGARQVDGEIDRSDDQRPTSEAKLREAQRAWIVFRDAHCTVQGYFEARGGSLEPISYEGCRAQLTRERTAQLRGQDAAQ